MTKRFKCSDVGFNCMYEISGESEDEIVRKAGEHMKKHSSQPMSADDEKKVRQHIKSM
jgi:predicted small metal-binding protein